MTAADHHLPIVGSPLRLQWPGEDDTAAYARRLAACPQVRDAFLVLRGDLGAGKTTFVRHLLRALGVAGRIKSPTYAVVEPHEGAPLAGTTAPMPIWHFDFYRFNDPREWEDAGFRDVFAGPGLKLAEWPDQAAGLLPTPDLSIDLAVQPDDTREVTVSAHTARGQALLAA
ncbi:MAG: tRNA (adenosine(37)-N6)-threonylcarbamoyltransferase complex ATPase subunit type 1 TsaE [Ramlibacter sp.]